MLDLGRALASCGEFRGSVEIFHAALGDAAEDFITVCLDPIVNRAPRLPYMTGGGVQVPIVFRMQPRGGRSAGAQHSQSLEAILSHIPGPKVFCPADARDAHDLLVEAVRDPNPVCFVENRRRYNRSRRRLGPGSATRRDAGHGARGRRRRGRDLGPDGRSRRSSAPSTPWTAVRAPMCSTSARSCRATSRRSPRASRGPGAASSSTRPSSGSSPVPYAPNLEAEMLPSSDDIADRIPRLAG